MKVLQRTFHSKEDLKPMAFSTVFHQVVKLIPRTEFESIVAKHNGDHRVRSMNCWTWFNSLLFGQLTGHDSIRAIERVFAHQDLKMATLGLAPVRKSTLADANEKRPVQVLEDLFQYTLKRAYAVAPRKHRFRFTGDVFALDSSTIELCLMLCPWARFHHEKTGKGAVKLHTAIDVANDLPQFVIITDGRQHDMKVAREQISFKPNDTVLMDKAYVDYAWMNDLNIGGVTFVTRAKKNCHFKVVESREVNRTLGLRADQTIYLTSAIAGKKYEGKLRRVSYRDPETGKWLVFLTNKLRPRCDDDCEAL